MSTFINNAQHAANTAGRQISITTNRIFPPKQREEKLKQIHQFANRNPKLAIFLAVQIALTGIPLLIFFIFAVSTLLISLSTCILFAITTAFTYTLFAVGIALLFLIPTLFIASCTAGCIFLWGLTVYLLLRRFNQGEALAKPEILVRESKEAQEANFTQENSIKSPKSTEIAALKDGQGFVNEPEWNKKWDQGTQERQKEFAKNLGIKIEAVTPVSS